MGRKNRELSGRSLGGTVGRDGYYRFNCQEEGVRVELTKRLDVVREADREIFRDWVQIELPEKFGKSNHYHVEVCRNGLEMEGSRT